MIARPEISRNEWTTAEIGAFEVGNFALFCCPAGRVGVERAARERRREEFGLEPKVHVRDRGAAGRNGAAPREAQPGRRRGAGAVRERGGELRVGGHARVAPAAVREEAAHAPPLALGPRQRPRHAAVEDEVRDAAEVALVAPREVQPLGQRHGDDEQDLVEGPARRRRRRRAPRAH